MKKTVLSLMMAGAALTAVAQAAPVVAPTPLRAGDKVAVMSIASTPRDSVAERAAAVLEQWGFKPVIMPHVTANHHGFAGTVEERLSDLTACLHDPEVKAIVSTRGGYGSSMLLEPLTRDTLARYGNKWIVGYSDITAIHSAMVCAGHQSLHANMGGYIGSHSATDSLNLLLRDVLMGKRPTYTVPGHEFNRPGSATGIVVGGNMAVFSNIAGSRDFDFLDRDNLADRDIILFFEDVGENISRVSSMFTQLVVKGVMKHVKGVIVGRFTEYSPSNGYETMEAMLRERLAPYGDIPICFDFPVSHDESWNYPMIVGGTATLAVPADGGPVTLIYHE